MIVYCFCGNRYEGDDVVICLNRECEAYATPVSARGEPTLEQIVEALDFVEVVESLQND